MQFTIKNRWSGAVLWIGTADTIRQAVEAAAENRGADLSGADLSGADLSGADLSGADLSGADLSGADLRGADLSGADLSGADLSGADLSGADLSGADLSGADLRGADLSGADLSGANLRGANLRGANLRGANLRGANLLGADLKMTDRTILPTGETWREYLDVVVPSLLAAGGKSIDSFSEAWNCHSWTNCPMAHAFGVGSVDKVPALFRPRAEQFVQFFDAGLIPRPTGIPEGPASCESRVSKEMELP